VSATFPTLTPFENSDFLLKEVDAFLAIEDDPTSSKVDQNLKICEAKTDKSSINEPLEVELKDLPPHLEYAFLEVDDKLPVIIVKDLSVEEKTALIKVLKSHKQAIAWKLFDIKEDVYVKVGTFHFQVDFVVVDFDADPRVPLILGRYFLKTKRALIDVFEGELTLRVGKEAITFNLDQTSRYSASYNEMTAKRIDVIDMACEEYSQEVLGFSDVIASGNPSPYYDPIVSATFPTLTPFENSDFLLK
nr:reverse transcriptase domain-containing protein [Tanacetum cinerariifolium]